jgi:hypothetical protein
MTPFKSDDLTTIIESKKNLFVVQWSPETAEHEPGYRVLGAFKTRQEAEAFLATD